MDGQFCFDNSPESLLLKKKYESALQRIEQLVPKAQFEKFIRPLAFKGKEAHVVVLTAPGKFLQVWVQDKYRRHLTSALTAEFGEPIDVHIEASLQERPETESETVLPGPSLNDSVSEQFTFENFVAGPNNQLAFNGAVMVSRQPGELCNPFFVYGRTGLGKTHLLCAIQNELRKCLSGSSVRYQTGQEFTTSFLAALERGTMTQFRRNVEGSTVWLVDDVQFLDGKARTQEEFFHLFNQLMHAGKQIVICADRPPRDLSRFEERLRSRLESGVVAEILAPDTVTRIEIVKKRSRELGSELPNEVCEFLATRISGNVRTLIGALKTFLATASLTKSKPDVDLAARVIDKQFGGEVNAKPTAERIIGAVASHLGVAETDLKSASRKAWVTRARHLAIYLVRESTGESWKRIGERFGGRDHSSIIHGFDKISASLGVDNELRRDVGALKRQIGIE